MGRKQYDVVDSFRNFNFFGISSAGFKKILRGIASENQSLVGGRLQNPFPDIDANIVSIDPESIEVRLSGEAIFSRGLYFSLTLDQLPVCGFFLKDLEVKSERHSNTAQVTIDLRAERTRGAFVRALCLLHRRSLGEGSLHSPSADLSHTVQCFLHASENGKHDLFEAAMQICPTDGVRATRTVSEWSSAFDMFKDEADRTLQTFSEELGVTPCPSELKRVPKHIAFYLPQFHPIEENDRWWGPGFTEWTGVSAARPLYDNHHQPLLPADLGFYDLRLKEVRGSQAELAKSYGIFGFCYYFYWFSGRRILERPLELMLAEKEPDLPFCLCWANEPWSRRWDGSEQELLIRQDHDPEEDAEIIEDLLPYFSDDRCIRIDGKPLFLVYRPSLMNDCASFVRNFRRAAAERGLPGIYLCNVMSFGDTDFRKAGFDAAVEFPPHNITASEQDMSSRCLKESFLGKTYSYESYVRKYLEDQGPSYPYFPGVMPRWDNTARKGDKSHIFVDSTPELFEVVLHNAAKRTTERNPDIPLVFINSWNEWGEGANLEPDRYLGRKYLEAVQNVGQKVAQKESIGKIPMESCEVLTKENELLSDLLRKYRSGPHLSEFREVTLRKRSECHFNDRYSIDYVSYYNKNQSFVLLRERDFSLVGWFFASEELYRPDIGLRCVALHSEYNSRTFIAPVSEVIHRPDVVDHLSLSNRDLRLGFSIRASLANVPEGNYKLFFLESFTEGDHRIYTNKDVVII